MSTGEILLTVAISILAPLAFVAFWCFVCFLISKLGGWSRLGESWPARIEKPPGTRLSSGQMGWMNYNGVLQVGSTDQGLYLGVVVFFRVGHRSLLIPWDRVREIGPAFSILKRRIKVDLDGVTATFFEDAYRSAESKRP